MSNRYERRRRKKGCGCGGALVTLLIFVLVAVILVSSGVLSKLRTKIEMQLYPLKYEEIVNKAAEEYDFSPALLCAVIHTESKFEYDAESHAGAQGLMQIMPETFSWLADRRGDDLTTDEMNTPEVSIDYGAYYLRMLTDIYGDKYTACAGYNAGTVVEEWLSDSRYSSDGVTLHSIPYEETSEYVSRIIHAEQMYEKLYFEDN